MSKHAPDELPVVTGAAWLDSHSMRSVLTFGFRRGGQILAVLLIALIPALIIPMVVSPAYESKAAILVTTSRADIVLTPSERSQTTAMRPVSESDISTEIEILRSPQLTERVVTDLVSNGTIVMPESDVDVAALQSEDGVLNIAAGPGTGTPNSVSAEIFAQNVDLIEKDAWFTPIGSSTLIEIGFLSEDPEYSFEVVNAILDAYLDRRTEIFQMPQAVSFFAAEKEAARNRLDSALLQIRDYGEIIGTPLIDIQGPDSPITELEKMLLGKLGQLEGDLAGAEVDVRATRERVAALDRELDTHPQAQTAERLDEINAEIAVLRLGRDTLVQEVDLDIEAIGRVDAEISLARARIRELQADLRDAEVQRFDTLGTQLSETRTTLDAQEARQLALEAQVVAVRGELEALAAVSFEVSDLHREILVAEEDYLLYVGKHEEARISAEMDRQRMVNVTVAQRPRVAMEPVEVNTSRNVALALVMGVVCGVGLAITREFYDHTFVTGDALERGLGVPHLASIPEGFDGSRNRSA